MRVHLFIEHYPNPYKPWIDTQLVQMIKAGHDVRIFAFGAYTSTLHDEVRQYGLLDRTGYLPGTLRGLRRHGPRALTRLVSSPAQELRRVGRSIGAASGAKHSLLVAARALCLPAEAPDVCYVHNLATAALLTFLKRLYPTTRVCLYFHGGEVGGQPRVGGEAHVFAAMDAVITSTRFAAGQAAERGCPPDKIAVVPLGFSIPAYSVREGRSYRPDGRVRFVSVGRMSPEKGFRHALAAVALLRERGRRDFTYTFVGSGVEHKALMAQATALGLDDVVHFAGEKTRTDVAEILQESDVFVLPSIATELWAETQATVVQEALLMGCLTVTTTAGGVPEANAPVMNERFSVRPADSAALAGAMEAAMGTDAAEMEGLAKAGRAFAAGRFDIAPLMDTILEHAKSGLPPSHPARYA